MNPGYLFLFLFLVFILVIGIGGALRLRARLLLIGDILERAEKTLKDSDKEIHMVFAQSSGLQQPWKRYMATFIAAPDGNPKTDRLAGDFFETMDIIDYHVNLRLYLALPNILVGIGVLGTFIGLVVGTGGFDAVSVDGVIESIPELLGSMSTAFYASIFGMMGSILFNFFEKTQIKTVKTQLQRVIIQLDDTFLLTLQDRRKIEKTQLARQLGAQSRLLGQTLSDLFALKSKGGGVVRPSYVLGALRSEAREQTAALKTFAEVMARVVGNHEKNALDQQELSLQSMKEIVEVAKEVLRAGVELTNKMRETGEVMDERFMTLQSSLQVIETSSKALQKTGEFLTTATASFQEEHQSLRADQKKHVQILIDALKRTQELSESQATQSEAIQEGLQTLFSEVKEGLSEHRKETGASMDGYVNKMAKQMEEATKSLKSAATTLSKEVKESGDRRDKKRPVIRR